MQHQLVPPWLQKLLETSFFSLCRTHGAVARSECNMYCLDCSCDAFCFYCRSSCHKDHQVIQIRRSSYHDVVRVSEIEKVLNIGGVQTYVINSARVLFLNERPQPKSGKAVSHICEICGRSLLDALRFCSLGCKVVGIKRNGNTSFVLEEISSSSTRRVE
ncbi:protein RGF1 INDUCIBLE TRANSCRIPTION FACTOR 1-like [Bidens hawaiensis]|uniref:protein RGF1 INDUCIBLE TRANSCRIPTION FACTOR 1-like n=1 Tax=Bidens hawaiensis TaxID=980011 RepID=UPI00404B54D7